jgi:amidohydrolase
MDALRHEADALAVEMVKWRREIHRHPELGFEEHRTAALVAKELQALGLEVSTGVARTGVVGVLRAASPRAEGMLLRADMDALPIEEAGRSDFRSEVSGLMHACGHDGHTAMLLGAAGLLARRREQLPRHVTFCFQPAEEGQGGAREMIAEGVLAAGEAATAFALHLWTPFPAGTVHVRPGPIMASSDEFHAALIGRGGHGAQPHLAVDPIVAASHAVLALQSVVSRFTDPLEPAVVTVGTFRAGHASNVIPAEATLEGTMRSLGETVRARLHERVRETLEGAARAGGCELRYALHPGYPAVVNDAHSVERVRRAGAEVFGEANLVEPAPLMAAEDFSYFLREVPGAFVLLGAGNDRLGLTAPHHSPEFDFDESVLPRGAELLARLALDPAA